MKYYHIKLFSYISLLLLVAGSSHASGWQKAVKCADKKAQKKYYAMAAERYENLLTKKCLPADSAYTVRIKLANCYMKMENILFIVCKAHITTKPLRLYHILNFKTGNFKYNKNSTQLSSFPCCNVQ